MFLQSVTIDDRSSPCILHRMEYDESGPTRIISRDLKESTTGIGGLVGRRGASRAKQSLWRLTIPCEARNGEAM